MKAHPGDAIPWPVPPLWWVALAFIVAPLVVAVAFAFSAQAGTEPEAWLQRAINTLLLILMFGAYPPTLLVGVPVYVFLRRRVRPTAFNCALAGLFVAGLPTLVLALIPSPAGSYSYGQNMQAFIVNGQRTALGWLSELEHFGVMCALGAVTGLVFWLVAVAGTRRVPAA